MERIAKMTLKDLDDFLLQFITGRAKITILKL